jgi:16S rRNA A1518/A1519 N6-dimethyltransferase RsmA/KsgA/DIM1 with predicted DNA glycosylase/AP lyase activity
MPKEAYWETLFDVGLILDRLGIDARLRNVIEMGCGYGTFTVPVARRISGTVTRFDIDEAMSYQLPDETPATTHDSTLGLGGC